jgi:aryl sulfotransferase
MKQSISRCYDSTLLESGRWSQIELRDGDIVVATPIKSGTTWVQAIILHLIFQDLNVRDVNAFSPWVEIRRRPFADILNDLKQQDHRRCMKTHLPLDGLPFDSRVKYVVIGRDPRDVFMSLWNFYTSFSDGFFDPEHEPHFPAFPRPPQNIHDFWQTWISQGTFPWERDGYPFWSVFHHMSTWWDARLRDNVLVLHFNDLLRDLPSEIIRIRDFLDISSSPSLIAEIALKVEFSQMKKDAAQIDPFGEASLKGGAESFIYKGTNGRWKDVLTDAELAQYRAAATTRLTSACCKWLEYGGVPEDAAN